MKKLFSDFKKFISRGNVVDMAIGVAVASAFTSIVNAFTKGVVSPIIALLADTSHLEEAKWVIREEVLDGETVVVSEVAILWGLILQSVINFLLIAIVLFLVMKIASVIRERAHKIHESVVNKLSDADERAAEEAARAKAEAEAAERAAEEARAEAERLAKEKEDAEIARLQRQEALLTEIRDLLRSNK